MGSQVCGSCNGGDPTEHMFSAPERRAVYRDRRTPRHAPVRAWQVSEDARRGLLHAAHVAPSVGLMQPRRFIRITDETLADASTRSSTTNAYLTAEALGARRRILALKVEALDCAELLVERSDRRGSHLSAGAPAPRWIWRQCRAPSKPVAGSAGPKAWDGWGASPFDPQRLAVLAGDARRRRTGGHSCSLGPVLSFRTGPRWNWMAGPTRPLRNSSPKTDGVIRRRWPQITITANRSRPRLTYRAGNAVGQRSPRQSGSPHSPIVP